MDEGATDDAIRDHLQERYGDFVLYDPPFKPSTWFLWFSPVILPRRRCIGADADGATRCGEGNGIG